VTVINPPGWLQNAGAVNTAAELRTYVSGLLGPAVSAASLIPAGGVHSQLGNKLVVVQAGSPNMTVVTRSGVAYIPGTQSGTQGAYAVENDADFTLTITANGSGLPRIDGVFFKVEDTQYSGAVDAASLVVVAGTPAGSPVPPAAPNNAIRLANVAVANGASSITNANITDTRTYAGGLTGAVLADYQVISASGTWTKPIGARYCRVQVVGGGGAGGGAGAAAANQHSKGSGGGAGGYAESWIDAATLGLTAAVTVGAGGTAVNGGSGNSGGSSNFGGTTVVASGGGGGAISASSAGSFGAAGGAGGAGSAGTIQMTGEPGQNSWGSGQFALGGKGGSSPLGAGGGRARIDPAGGAISTSGAAGTGFGAGGSGGIAQNGGAGNGGGAGAAGVVIVTTYL
jgi:hypothetical protein